MAAKPAIASSPSLRPARQGRVVPPGPEGLTVDDYLQTPDDGRCYELINGEILVSPAPRRPHQETVSNLLFELSAHVREHKLGVVLVSPLDYVLDQHNVVQPDIIFLPNGHPQLNDMENLLNTPPGLAIEVLSPTGIQRDLRIKFTKYQDAGVEHYWVADPEREIIEAWQLHNGKYRKSHKISATSFSAPPFPKLIIKLADVFTRRK